MRSSFFMEIAGIRVSAEAMMLFTRHCCRTRPEVELPLIPIGFMQRDGFRAYRGR
jgi:hypothetical protein